MRFLLTLNHSGQQPFIRPIPRSVCETILHPHALSVMDMKNWDVMVTVEVPEIGEFRHVGSALEAVDCLYSCWRGPRGDVHREAINTCLAVLDDDKPAEASRDAFIAAAKDSHISVRY